MTRRVRRAFPGHTTPIARIGVGLALAFAMCGAAVAGPGEDAEAPLNLGFIHRDGQGAAPDDGAAPTWLRAAADQGDAQAQYTIGLMYQTGRGAPRDDAQAVAWWRKAADQGYAPAQNNLGDMYALGHGVPKNLTRSYMWISLAIARLPASDVRDRAQALDNRRVLAARMTPTQIVTARLMAGRWTPTVAAKPER